MPHVCPAEDNLSFVPSNVDAGELIRSHQCLNLIPAPLWIHAARLSIAGKPFVDNANVPPRAATLQVCSVIIFQPLSFDLPLAARRDCTQQLINI